MCHGVLYKQLTAWMLHGMLIDKYNEFFVQKAQRSTEASTVTSEDDELGLAGISSQHVQHLMASVSHRDEKCNK